MMRVALIVSLICNVALLLLIAMSAMSTPSGGGASGGARVAQTQRRARPSDERQLSDAQPTFEAQPADCSRVNGSLDAIIERLRAAAARHANGLSTRFAEQAQTPRDAAKSAMLATELAVVLGHGVPAADVDCRLSICRMPLSTADDVRSLAEWQTTTDWLRANVRARQVGQTEALFETWSRPRPTDGQSVIREMLAAFWRSGAQRACGAHKEPPEHDSAVATISISETADDRFELTVEASSHRRLTERGSCVVARLHDLAASWQIPADVRPARMGFVDLLGALPPP